jgi:hypothetical protein
VKDDIQAGDTIFHRPTGEEWYLVGVSKAKNQVCAAGWPPSIAYLSDCELVKKGNGLKPEELEYRNKEFGTSWD